MATKVATLRPVADVSPLWIPTPDDGSAHFTKIDESVGLSDGDVTKLRAPDDLVFANFLIAALPDDLRRSTQVRLRTVAKVDSVFATTLFIINVDGVDLDSGPDSLGYDWTILPINQWTLLERVVTVMPQLHGNEVIKLGFLGFCDGGVLNVEVTAVELEITYKTSLTDFTDVPTPSTVFTKVQV